MTDAAKCSFVGSAGARCGEFAAPGRYFGRYCEQHAELIEAWMENATTSESAQPCAGRCHSRPQATRTRGRRSEYDAYRQASARCNNPSHPRYTGWGGRGIKFLFASFEQFMAEVGPRPSGKTVGGGRALYSIHRIDNDGHYEPGNVKWATDSEQHAPGARRRLRSTRPRKTHCVHGHEYTDANTYWRKDGTGRRQCLACCKSAAAARPSVARRAEPTATELAIAGAMREQRILSGLTFGQLSRVVGIAGPRLCRFERGSGRLRPEELERCESGLREAMIAQLARIDALMGRDSVSAYRSFRDCPSRVASRRA